MVKLEHISKVYRTTELKASTLDWLFLEINACEFLPVSDRLAGPTSERTSNSPPTRCPSRNCAQQWLQGARSEPWTITSEEVR